jgi:uncharacterized protein YuzE
MDLTYDSDTNTLRLTPTTSTTPHPPTGTTTLDAILDIGEAGRLIGVEFPADKAQLRHWQTDPLSGEYLTLDDNGDAYIQITSGNTGTASSTPIRLIAEYNPAHQLTALVIPRRGDGYEITYPSGNQ